MLLSEHVYIDCLEAVCEKFKARFMAMKSVVKNISKLKYELPSNNKPTYIRNSGFTIYINKPTDDLFDIEYIVEMKLNFRNFAAFITNYLRNRHVSKFNFMTYEQKQEFFNDLENVINIKYKFKPKIQVDGNYIKFKIPAFLNNTSVCIDI